MEETKNKLQTVKEPFLRDNTLWARIQRVWNKQDDIIKELKEPLLLLMKDNGYTDIIEGILPGDFVIETPKGQKVVKLSPDKFTTLKYGGKYYKCWIAYENCATPYPENPLYTAEMMHKTTQKLAMNWRDRDEATQWEKKGKFWLYLLIGIAIAIVLVFSTGILDPLINAGSGQTGTVTTAVATTVQNSTTQALTQQASVIV